MEKDLGKSLSMCWFGKWQTYATSVVHSPEHEITPKELDSDRLIFIWDEFMKSDILAEFLGVVVPWSPALLEGFARVWLKKLDGSYSAELVKKLSGKCLGAVLLTSRLSAEEINKIIKNYDEKGYSLSKNKVLIGDIVREIEVFLPKKT